MQVLISDTSVATKAMRSSDQVGTLEAGTLADLVVLSAKPLEDIKITRKIDSVRRKTACLRSALRLPLSDWTRLLPEGSSGFVEQVRFRGKYLPNPHNLLVCLLPSLLLDCFTHAWYRLHAVTSVESRRVDHVAEPRSSGQSSRVSELPFTLDQHGVDSAIIRRRRFLARGIVLLSTLQ